MGTVTCIQKKDSIDTPSAKIPGNPPLFHNCNCQFCFYAVFEKIFSVFSDGDVACFSEYMEVWIHRVRIDGFGDWLSGALQIRGNCS